MTRGAPPRAGGVRGGTTLPGAPLARSGGASDSGATARAVTRDALAMAILPEAARAVAGRTAYVVLADESGDLTMLHVGTDAAEAAAPESLAPPSRASVARVSVVPASSPPSLGGAPLCKLRVKAGEGLVGAAIASGQTIVVADVDADPRQSARMHQALFPGGDQRGAPCAIVPLLDEADRAFGALAVLRRAGDKPFHDDDVDLLRLVALNASTGFQLQAAREAHARQARLSTIGSLVSGMLHDLKTPMSVISGYVQMMATDDDPALRAEYADLVLRQFDHIAAMQREVLDFARGERTVLLRRVYVAKFFDDLAEQLRRDLARKHAPVELVMELRDRGTARFDEPKMLRALHNLTRNAVEAMGERGGTLTIVVARDPEGALTIAVRDTGPGIPPEIEERLFESFVTAGKKTGTGLGLAIVKKIAEDHGGTIAAKSTPQGATFTLRLPQPHDALKKTPTAPPVR
ncbi:MAG: hypothetical protein NVS3B10_26780 [Polyangiales bacterium]